MQSLTPTAWLAVTGGLLLVVVLLLVLQLRTARRLRAARRAVTADHAQTARLEVSVADQGGRLRIIRELHDIAVARISAMVVQAEGAQYAGGTDPGAAVRASGAIADLGRTTLADLRRVMTLVRDDATGTRPALPSTRDLLDTMRAAGLRVRFEESGEPYALEAGAELAAGVEEDLRSLTQELDGAGIGEMRARAELYGGTLTATETPGVGFSITATFPSIRFHNGVHGVDLTRR